MYLGTNNEVCNPGIQKLKHKKHTQTLFSAPVTLTLTYEAHLNILKMHLGTNN